MKPLEYIIKYWVLIIATITVISGSAIAGQKIKTLEEAMKKQVAQTTEIHELKTEQRVLIERTTEFTKKLEEQKKETNKKLDKQQELLLKILLKIDKE